jgi:uncharacterized membrane protein YphA (DoxX/SURF4 family)
VHYIALAGRVLFGVVFLVSGWTKAREPREFARSVRGMGLVAPSWAGRVAATVAVLELAVPVLLAVPVTVPAGFGLAGVLLVVFTTAIALALRRGTTAPCRCFGASRQPLGRRQLGRNVLLLVVLAAAAPAAGAGTGDLRGAAIAVPAGLVGAILVVFFDELAELFAGPVRLTP